MLRSQIYDDLKEAMKTQNKDTLGVLRYVWSEIKYAEVDAKHELSDEEVTQLLRREVKKRNEAVEQMKTGGRSELVEKETKELVIIEAYLPAMMDKAAVEKVVDEVVAGGAREFGAVMGQVMGRLKGKADGKLVSEVVREKLQH